MHSIAAFILRGRLPAVAVVVGAALLPLLNFCSGAALTLVTLRKGAREGLLTLAIAVCLTIALTGLLFGSTLPALALLLIFWLPLWLLAGVLRYTISLNFTAQLGLLLAALALAGLLAGVEDSAGWGRRMLEQRLEPLLQSLQLPNLQQAALTALLAPIMPGLIVGNILVSTLLSLLLGRWWQSLLVHPGGFGAEFRALRLDPRLALLTAAVVAGAIWLRWPFLINLSLLLLAVYALQSIALAHAIVKQAQLAQGWLVGFYAVLALLPQSLVLLSLLGWLDAWVNIRARIKSPAGIV